MLDRFEERYSCPKFK